MEQALLELITDQMAAGNSINLNDEVTITDAAEIADLEFGESHGRQAITVTVTDGTAYGPFRVNDVSVLDGTGTALGELYDFAEDDLIKAGWNWSLITNDGSGGVHNPAFANEVSDVAINELEAS